MVQASDHDIVTAGLAGNVGVVLAGGAYVNLQRAHYRCVGLAVPTCAPVVAEKISVCGALDCRHLCHRDPKGLQCSFYIYELAACTPLQFPFTDVPTIRPVAPLVKASDDLKVLDWVLASPFVQFSMLPMLPISAPQPLMFWYAQAQFQSLLGKCHDMMRVQSLWQHASSAVEVTVLQELQDIVSGVNAIALDPTLGVLLGNKDLYWPDLLHCLSIQAKVCTLYFFIHAMYARKVPMQLAALLIRISLP